MEAVVHNIPEAALAPEGSVKLGTLLAEIGKQVKLTDNEFGVFEKVREKTPANPVNFG